MRNFLKLASGVNILPLLHSIQRQPHPGTTNCPAPSREQRPQDQGSGTTDTDSQGQRDGRRVNLRTQQQIPGDVVQEPGGTALHGRNGGPSSPVREGQREQAGRQGSSARAAHRVK